MDIEETEALWLAITVIEARESLREILIADFPHQKKTARNKTHRELSKQAFPASFKVRKKITMEDMAKLLSGGK